MFTLKNDRSREIGNLSFSPDGRLLFAGYQLWDLTERKSLFKFASDWPWNINALFTEDGEHLIQAKDRRVFITTFRNVLVKEILSTETDCGVRQATPDRFFTWTYAHNQPRNFSCYDLSTLTDPKLLWNIERTESQRYTRFVQVSPDSKTFVLMETEYANSNYFQSLHLFDFANGKLIRPIPLLETYFHYSGLFYHPSGEKLLVLSPKRISVFNLKDGKHLNTIKMSQGTTIERVAPHPNGRVFLTLHRGDGLIKVWDIDTLEVKHSFQWPIYNGASLAISPDGLTCAIGDSRGGIVVWDWE